MGPVRELIQNAADAVRFRREVEPAHSSYSGRITARLRDDEAVLTGPLIDFGASYVSSSLLKAERPGLLSKGRKRAGKFGIGFFSAFMITGDITVLSRPFDQGIDQSRILKFSEDSQIRPILLDAAAGTASPTISTRVALKLERAMLSQVLRFHSALGNGEAPVTFSELIGAICPMLDVDIFIDTAGEITRVHSRNWFEEDRVYWLRRISLPHTSRIINHSVEAIEAEIKEAAPSLTFIDPADPSAGLAAVSGVAARGVRTVGMLRATEGFNQYANEFWGAIDYQAAEPRRSHGRPRSGALLSRWASEQALLAAEQIAGGNQQRIIALHVADFEGDAAPIASIKFNREWLSLNEAFKKTCVEGKIYVPVAPVSSRGDRVGMGIVRERQSGFIDNHAPNELEYLLRAFHRRRLRRRGYGTTRCRCSQRSVRRCS